MLKLDNNLLEELGLGTLPEDQKRQMLQHIYETLELRVGTQLANQMTDKQLEEFERFIDAGGDANQAQALQWLETNLPNYKQVVQDVFEALKIEVKGMAPQLLQAASQQVPGPQAQPIDSQTAYQSQVAQPQQYQSIPTPSQPMQQPVSAPVPQPGFTAMPPSQPNPVAPGYGAPQQPVAQGPTPVQPVQDFTQSTPQPQQPFMQPPQPQPFASSMNNPDPAQPWQPPQPPQPQQPDQPQWQPPQPPQQ